MKLCNGSLTFLVQVSLHEKCPNMEFFLVGIFPHSDSIRRDTLYLSVFSPNAGKYGPEKTPYLDTFHTVFDSPYIKRDQIFTITNFAYKLPHELPNDSRLGILGNQEILERSQNWLKAEPSVQSHFQKLDFGHGS